MNDFLPERSREQNKKLLRWVFPQAAAMGLLPTNGSDDKPLG
jgi:hypothetical protein